MTIRRTKREYLPRQYVLYVERGETLQRFDVVLRLRGNLLVLVLFDVYF